MPEKSKHKPFSELVKQIEAYGLKEKLANLVHKDEAKRPFRHLPKQFSKGILIGNITSILIDSAFVIPWVWLGAGILLCLFVGLISGIYPAIKASRLDPIEALRHE